MKDIKFKMKLNKGGDEYLARWMEDGLCRHVLNKYWNLDKAETILITVSDKPSEHAYPVELAGCYVIIDGKYEFVLSDTRNMFTAAGIKPCTQYYADIWVLDT